MESIIAISIVNKIEYAEIKLTDASYTIFTIDVPLSKHAKAIWISTEDEDIPDIESILYKLFEDIYRFVNFDLATLGTLFPNVADLSISSDECWIISDPAAFQNLRTLKTDIISDELLRYFDEFPALTNIIVKHVIGPISKHHRISITLDAYETILANSFNDLKLDYNVTSMMFDLTL
mgnify:CR=1 FL=1